MNATTEIGVRVVRWNTTLEGVLLSVDWNARTAVIETWRAIDTNRYSWLESVYPLDAVTLAVDVRRPCEIYSEFDLARMCDDGSEALAQAEHFDDLRRWLRGYGWGL